MAFNDVRQPMLLISAPQTIVAHVEETYEPMYDVLHLVSLQDVQRVVESLHGAHVALVLVAEEESRVLGLAAGAFPAAKRVLLTSSSEPDVEHLRALPRLDAALKLPSSRIQVENDLYPVLDDLLESWKNEVLVRQRAVVLQGPEHSPSIQRLATFLAGQGITYRYELAPATQALFEDGTYLHDPSLSAFATHLGFSMQPAHDRYDLAIVGAGPAGMAAAIYAASEGMKVVLIERNVPGGQAGSSSRLENFPGFPAGVSGGELARKMLAQAKRFHVEVLSPQAVLSLTLGERWEKVLTLGSNDVVRAQAVLLATGVSYRMLQAPGIERLRGNGVYYGASLGAVQACRGKSCYVIGGANSAGQAAVHLSEYAERVTLLVRGDSLAKGMSSYLIEEIAARRNIEVRMHANVTAVHGQDQLETVTFTSPHGEVTAPAAGVFIFIGAAPETGWLGSLVQRDAKGFLLTGTDMFATTAAQAVPNCPTLAPVTNVSPLVSSWPLQRAPLSMETWTPGLFASGDVRSGSIKRAATSAGEGASAVTSIHRFLAFQSQ